MRNSLYNFIKGSIFVECTLPDKKYGICKTKYTTAEDYCLSKISDQSIATIIYNNIVEYAIKECDIDYANLDEELCRAIAENLKYDEEAEDKTKLKYGFYGEVLLYSLLVTLFPTDVLISKGYFYSPLEKGEPKGYDAYHLIQHDDKVELWFGEAKFRKDYKSPIKEVLANFSKTTSGQYFTDNILTIVKESHHISNGKDIINKLIPITQTWKKNIVISIAEELKKHRADLVYPIMIAYQQSLKDTYYEGIKKCVNYIEEQFNTGEFKVNGSFPIRIFFLFFPVDNVKAVKEQVVKWISEKKPLIS